MNLLELKEYVDRAIAANRHTAKDIQVRIRVHRDFSVGATPTVPVQDVSLGFDWDHNSFMVTPERPLVERDRTT